MLTNAQLQTLKATILADSALASQPMTSGGANVIASTLNLLATPDFYVWKTSVPVDEIMQNGFDWTRVDNLTVGKARIWDWMMRTGFINPSGANVRAGVLATFGVAADLNTRQTVFNHCQRLASRVEKLFATGSGTTTTDQGIGPAIMGFEGPLTSEDVQAARES